MFVGGCADTHNIIQSAPEMQKKLPKDVSFYIALPEDGVYGETTYYNSGVMTAQTILASVSHHVSTAGMADQTMSIEDCIAVASEKNFDYLINTTIMHWEDRSTEWSGKPDRIKVKIEIIAISDGSSFDSVTIEGKSKWVTFGGDHPQDLLPKPIGDYFDQLF